MNSSRPPSRGDGSDFRVVFLGKPVVQSPIWRNNLLASTRKIPTRIHVMIRVVLAKITSQGVLRSLLTWHKPTGVEHAGLLSASRTLDVFVGRKTKDMAPVELVHPDYVPAEANADDFTHDCVLSASKALSLFAGERVTNESREFLPSSRPTGKDPVGNADVRDTSKALATFLGYTTEQMSSSPIQPAANAVANENVRARTARILARPPSFDGHLRHVPKILKQGTPALVVLGGIAAVAVLVLIPSLELTATKPLLASATSSLPRPAFERAVTDYPQQGVTVSLPVPNRDQALQRGDRVDGKEAGLMSASATHEEARPPALYSAIVIAADSGSILESVNSDTSRPPTGLAKLMTVYLTLKALRDGKMTLDQQIPVSAQAASQEGLSLKLRAGSKISVNDAILASMVRSANDAAVALGEKLGRDENHFGLMMTQEALALGLKQSRFVNASGLPNSAQKTSARDVALLTRMLIKEFPIFSHYFGKSKFTLRGQVVWNRSHNGNLSFYPGTDGIKTGWTEGAGYSLVASAVHGNTRLIGVVLGANSDAERDARMAALLDQGFTRVAERTRTSAATREVPPLVSMETSAAKPSSQQWAIRVNQAVSDARSARKEANSLATMTASDSPEEVAELARDGRRVAWHPQVVRLTAASALGACSQLSEHGLQCSVVRSPKVLVSSRH